MDKNEMKRNLAYYKGRLIDFQELILQEEDEACVRIYLVSYLKCHIAIKTIEAKLGFVHSLPGKVYPITQRKIG